MDKSIWMGRSDNTHIEGGSAQPNSLQDRGMWQAKGNNTSFNGSVVSPHSGNMWQGSERDGKIPVSQPIAQAKPIPKPGAPVELHPDADVGLWGANHPASKAML